MAKKKKPATKLKPTEEHIIIYVDEKTAEQYVIIDISSIVKNDAEAEEYMAFIKNRTKKKEVIIDLSKKGKIIKMKPPKK